MVRAFRPARPARQTSEIRVHVARDVERLARGECRVGVDKADITPKTVEPMAGFSWSGSRGRAVENERLWARALCIEDIETRQCVVLCIVDLLSASAALTSAVDRELRAAGHEELVGRVILSGTHTHTGPGRFFGNRFYDRLAAPVALSGFNRGLTRELAASIARACIGAARRRRLGDLVVQRAELWGVGRNRSIEAHRANATNPEAPARRWGPPPSHLTEEEQAVDPRLTVWCARVDGEPIGAFAWFACHGTALGRQWRTYHRDWLGFAVDAAERDLQGVLCAVGSGASGDVTPLPAGSSAPVDRLALAREVGERVGAKLIELVRAAPGPSGRRLAARLDTGIFEIEQEGSTPRWQVGVPVLGGSEDGGPAFGRLQVVAEGFRGDSGPQRPKAPALGFLQALTLGPLDIGHRHPWFRLRLDDFVLCTVPGEPTVMAALTLEHEVQARLGVGSVGVIGYAGDYCGYFTTPAEYHRQHYEGASTLYGPRSLEWYRAQLLGPSVPAPSVSDPLARPSGAVPCRHVQRLLDVAHELRSEDGSIELLFASLRGDGSAAPRVRLERDGDPRDRGAGSDGAGEPRSDLWGVARPFANPDPEGAGELETFVAVFERGPVAALGLELERARLIVEHGSSRRVHAVVPNERAEQEGRLPGSARREPTLNGLRRSLLGLGVLLSLVGMLLLGDPSWVLAGLGWSPAGADARAFRLLMTRSVGLTFLLLGVNLLVAKNSKDRRALSGLAHASSLFAVAIAAFAYFAQHDLRVTGLAGLAAVGLGLFALRISAGAARPPTASRAHWEFWTPLFWVGLLTLVAGAVLLLLPAPVASLLGIDDPGATAWLRLYGAGFWVNTVAMWTARHTRDLRVVSGQLWGSLLFDTFSTLLLSIAIAKQVLEPPGLVVLPAFLAIVAWMRALMARAYEASHLEIEKPRTVAELGRIVRDARRGKKLVRVLGSGHSAPPAIHGDAPPRPRGSRPSRERCVHVSLDRLDRVIDVDRPRRRITVQAGLRIGVDPGHEPSSERHLLAHLRELGWALGDLGGIVHQTIAGFLATGSSGGSVSHALSENVVELRFVDGGGDVRVARRGAPGLEGELFEAVSVSMGLLGIVTEVTLECEDSYQVQGRELTAEVRDGVAELPADGGASTSRFIDLRAAGDSGLAAYLREPGYKRLLWWPQAKISAMAVWEARRTDVVPSVPAPYEAPHGVAQFVAGRALELLGWSYAVGHRGIIGHGLRRKLLPPLARQFLPKKPVAFHAPWDENLPMDSNVDEAFLPVEFTELWFDIDVTHAVMDKLLELYRAHEELAGTFAVELYAAKRCSAWLSPSHGRDSFRVDIFWYQRNAGDPVIDYYPRFYEELAPLAFRAHWGKYLPEPGSPQGADYLTGGYPRWADFAALRRELDPDGTFLSVYWRRHLDLH